MDNLEEESKPLEESLANSAPLVLKSHMEDWEDDQVLFVKRTAKILRKFNEVTYDMLLKHAEGLPFDELQARIEHTAGMAFEEVGIERFAHFIMDCNFLEIRSCQKLSSKKLFVFVKEDWLDEVNIKIRNVIPRLPDGVYREDTNLEETSVTLRNVPRTVRPMTTNGLPDECTRITSVKLTEFSNGMSAKIQPNERLENRRHIPSAAVTPVAKNSTTAAPKHNIVNCRMKSFTTFKWPLEEFAVTLLGCDHGSYLYIRPLQRSLQDRHEQLKKSLQDFRLSWPTISHTLTAIQKEELNVGMIVLAMNMETNTFARARVDQIEPNKFPYPIVFTDLDEGEQFRGAYMLNFEIPEKFRKLFFQAIKVGLDLHCEHLGTRAIADVFSRLKDLQGELSCELVAVLRDERFPDEKVPVVKLCRASNKSLVSFNHLISNDSKNDANFFIRV